jgi:hypothetical protein
MVPLLGSAGLVVEVDSDGDLRVLTGATICAWPPNMLELPSDGTQTPTTSLPGSNAKHPTAAAQATADALPARTCQVCFSEARPELGLECAQGHFTCDDCFAGGNLNHQLSVENRASFAAHGARLVCSMCAAPNVHVFTERELANHLDEASIQRYRKAAEEVASVQDDEGATPNLFQPLAQKFGL